MKRKKLLLGLVCVIVTIVSVVMFSGNNELVKNKQMGSRITLDDRTKFELVVKHDGKFVEVEGGMIYSLPRLWRKEIGNLEGKKITIQGTRHLHLGGKPIYINGEEVISQDVTNRGMAIRLVTNYATYTYTGTVLIVDHETHYDVYRIYFPHRYV